MEWGIWQKQTLLTQASPWWGFPSARVLRLEAVVFSLNLGAAAACELELFASFLDTATVGVGFILAADIGT